MQPPIFITGDDVLAFHSIEDAERYLEPADLRAGSSAAFDSTGLRLQLKVVPKETRVLFGLVHSAVDHVELEPGEEEPSGRAHLEEVLRGYLEAVGKPPEWLQRASSDELVREAAAWALAR